MINEAVGSYLQDHLLTILPFPSKQPDTGFFLECDSHQASYARTGQEYSGISLRYLSVSAFISLEDVLASTQKETLDVNDFISHLLPNQLSGQHQRIKDRLTGSESASTHFEILPSYLRPPDAIHGGTCAMLLLGGEELWMPS